jgi:hypothetical protein
VTVAAHQADGSRDRAAESTHDRSPDRARDREPERAPAPVTGARGSHDLAALPVAASRATSLWRGAVVQTKLTVSAPGDPLEVEADAVAARVVRGAEPRPPKAPDLSARGRLLRAATPARGPPPSAGSAERGSRSVGSIVARQGGGRPLDRAVRERIEPHLGMDLGSVRVRDGPDAAAAAHALHARAFTSGSTIFLAAGSSPADLGLMAHEATHVVQQASLPATRTTLMRDVTDLLPDISLPDVSVADIIPAWILDGVRSAVQSTPGYALLTYITGTDPLTGAPVPVSREWFVDQLLSFGPFGAGVGAVLGAIDVVDGIFDLLAAELATHDLTAARIQRDIDSAWAQLSIAAGIEGNLAIVRGYVERLLADVAAFVVAIAERVLALVRTAAATAAEAVLATPAIQPVWSLAKKVLHYDPLRGVPVEAATVEILADFLRLIGEEERLAQMEERGTLQQTADWLDTQFETFAGLATELATLYSDAWAAIQPENLPNLLANLEGLAASTVAYVQGVAAFAFTVVAKVLELVKQALLGLLSEHAHMLPGFHLLTVIIGQNPFTGEAVPLTAENLIRGFITLIPGGEATYDELVQSGVIPAAAARIEGAIASLGLTLELVTSTFLGIWNSLGLDDLLDPIAAFVRVLAAFGEPLWRLAQFVPVVVQVVIELILALMNFPSELLGRVIANVSAAIGDITRDPIGFLKNLVEALKAGFLAFFSNIVVHVTQGLVDWLFRGLGQLGITLPTDFSLASILGLVFQVLGLTAETLWEKLTEHLGAETVRAIQENLAALTGAWAFIVDVQQRGLVAIWELVVDQLSSLWETLLGVAMEWVMTQIITSGTIKLLSFLDPTFIMSIVNGCIAFFNAVQAAIEYFRDMLELLDLYVGTIAQIAAGNIAPGAQMVEQGLAAAVPMAIGFLAYLLGIDDIPYRIADIIRGVRDAIDRAIDWLIEQAIRLGSAALELLRGGTPTPAAVAAAPEPVETGDPEHDAAVTAGLTALAVAEEPYLVNGEISQEDAVTVAARVKEEHPVFTVLQVVDGGDNWDYEWAGSPGGKHGTRAKKRKADPGVSAEGLGVVGMHGSKPSSLRKGPRIHWLESEHIIPFACGKQLWDMVGFVVPGRGGHEDRQQTTIMLYYDAAREKTPDDNEMSKAFAGVLEDAGVRDELIGLRRFGSPESPARVLDIFAWMSEQLEATKENAITRTVAAVETENQMKTEGSAKTNGARRGPPGTPEMAVPTRDDLDVVAEIQYDNIIEILTDELEDANILA